MTEDGAPAGDGRRAREDPVERQAGGTDNGARDDAATDAVGDRQSPDAAAPRAPAAAANAGGSGAANAALFHRALAAVFLVAWWSLGVQVRLLIGADGLLPFADFVAAARAEGALDWTRFPTVLALHPTDAVLVGGTWLGAGLGLAGLAGFRPRLVAALQTALYLGYVCACRTFLGFQWDNLLLECGLLAVFLPADRPAPIAHFLFRALAFKLYFESGLAKAISPLHDWWNGSAMAAYYETAPIPTRLAWFAHHLPHTWHVLESWATLVLELVMPWLFFAPRRARRCAAAAFAAFQLVNAATANYGFFCYLSLALSLFLVDESTLAAFTARTKSLARVVTRGVWARVRGKRSVATATATATHGDDPAEPARAPIAPGTPHPPPPPPWPDPPRPATATSRIWLRARPWLARAGAGAWVVASLVSARFHLGGAQPAPLDAALIPIAEVLETFRVVNSFHLFASVTTERIEPEFQVRAGDRWVPMDFRYKPGPLDRAPPLVAPHQPRVDFLLWFYGLSFARRQPSYVVQLLVKLCDDPGTVAPLFTKPVPANVQASRIAFFRYRFSSWRELREHGQWWTRTPVDTTTAMSCVR